jgi:hypothetical protein
MAERNKSTEPGMSQTNLGAVAGGVIGSAGGLFAVGIPPAIVARSLQGLFSTPTIAVICFFIAGILGMVIGGVLGPQARRLSPNPWMEREWQAG